MSEYTNTNEWNVIIGGKNRSKNRPKPVIHCADKKKTNTQLSKPTVGSSASNALACVPKKQLSYTHVYRLSPATSRADLKKFLNNTIPNLVCEKLNSKKPEVHSSISLSFSSEFQSQLLDPVFWPEGITVTKFFRKLLGTKTKARQWLSRDGLSQ